MMLACDDPPLDWHAIQSAQSARDRDAGMGAATKLYNIKSSEELELDMDCDAVETFPGLRCHDFNLIAVAASPLCP